MSFICWLLAGLLSAWAATRFLAQKRPLIFGLLFLIVPISSVFAGWWASQQGWEWGDALHFNYHSVLPACAAGLILVTAMTPLLNLFYPASKDKELDLS